MSNVFLDSCKIINFFKIRFLPITHFYEANSRGQLFSTLLHSTPQHLKIIWAVHMTKILQHHVLPPSTTIVTRFHFQAIAGTVIYKRSFIGSTFFTSTVSQPISIKQSTSFKSLSLPSQFEQQQIVLFESDRLHDKHFVASLLFHWYQH